ncbi:hypothetical protein ACVGWG_00650, partial [Enterobacter asburiae]
PPPVFLFFGLQRLKKITCLCRSVMLFKIYFGEMGMVDFCGFLPNPIPGDLHNAPVRGDVKQPMPFVFFGMVL